jgi:phage virion morphogenesis protein
MAGTSFSMRVSGSAAIDARLAALAAANGDLSDLMDILGLYLESSTIERFDTETAPDGSKWTPSRRAREQGGKTLTDSARLKSSISHRSSATEAEVGTNVIYARIHQYGGTIRPKNGEYLTFALPGGLGFRRVSQVTMPARPFLGLSDEDETEILALAEDYERDAVPEIEG